MPFKSNYEIETPQGTPDDPKGQEKVDVFLPQLFFKKTIDVHAKKKKVNLEARFSSTRIRGTEVPDVHVDTKKTNFSETLPGGSSKPASFAVNTISANDPGNGLQKFLATLNILKRIDSKIEIVNQIYSFPLGNAFSLCEGGPRKYAFCRLTNLTTGQSFYLFEVGRPDNWSVSTILIKSRSCLAISEDEQESLRKTMEAMLLKFNGHWDRIWMKQNTDFNFSFMKHVKRRGPKGWAERILELVSK